jgi:hypothetical protein
MSGRIIHIFSQWNRTRPGDQRRHADAVASWHHAHRTAGDWVLVPVDEGDMKRNAKTVLGDPFPLPFVRDVIDMGIEQARGQPNDLALWVNDDSCLTQDIANDLMETQLGWASRRDFMAVPRRLTKETVAKGHFHPGADLTVFPVSRWTEMRQKLPDMVLCREQFDVIWKDLIGRMGGKEIKNVVAHMMHANYWESHSSDPSAMHNKEASEQYRRDNGMPTHW